MNVTIAALALFSGSAVAQTDVFVVSDVAVDALGRTTTEARTQGLQDGQIEALNRLFKRLVPRAYHSDIPGMAARDAIDLVRDFSVSNERTTSGRYLADLKVRFQPDAVRSVLRFAEVPFAETVSKPVVIIPVYQESVVSAPVIWADSNPWLEAWGQLRPSDGLVPRQLPYGDLEDLTSLRIEDVVAHDGDRLEAWASRYGADDSVIATASLLGSLGAESVRVVLYFSRTRMERSFDVPASGGQTWADLFKAAATEAWFLIEDEWKKENMLQFGVTGQITALVPLTSLEGWLAVRTRLQRVPLIDRFELQAITRDRAQVTLYYIGDENQLKLAMAQSDLGFIWQDEAWVIEDRAAPTNNIQTFGAEEMTSPMPIPRSSSPNNRLGLAEQPPAYPSSGLFGTGAASQGP